MWDITYPILVMEHAQIIIVNMQKFLLWPLWGFREMGSGNSLLPPTSSHSQGLWLFSQSTPKTKDIAGKTQFLLEDEQIQFSVLSCMGLTLFLVPSHFFSRCLWKVSYYVILFCLARQQESQSWHF